MPTRYAHWCTRCERWWEWGRGKRQESPELGGPDGNPARARIRLHLNAFDLECVTVRGARDGHLVAGVSNNLILVRDLIDLAIVGHQNCGISALDAAGG